MLLQCALGRLARVGQGRAGRGVGRPKWATRRVLGSMTMSASSPNEPSAPWTGLPSSSRLGDLERWEPKSPVIHTLNRRLSCTATSQSEDRRRAAGAVAPKAQISIRNASQSRSPSARGEPTAKMTGRCVPCDNANQRPRARQYVAFELGFFSFGTLGRDHVTVLHKRDLELPSERARLRFSRQQLARAVGRRASRRRPGLQPRLRSGA